MSEIPGSSLVLGISSSAQVDNSSSSANPGPITGSRTVSIRVANNPHLFQDILFTQQPDSSFSAEVAKEVDLSHVVLAFDYSGKVELGGTPILSGINAVPLLEESVIKFDDKPILFRIQRQYLIPVLFIHTLNGAEIASQTDYVDASMTMDGKNLYADYSAKDVQIRLRGNSSRIFYDKKPYRLKLGSKTGLLGMQEDKDWVLLANYRDPTHFMNAVAFDMARYMNLPFTNSNRFVEVFLNDTYIGMYQLTEQVEQGANRVAVDEISGVLLNLDLDDGPELAPIAGDNFYSSVYELPICVKHPKNQTATQLETIKADFAALEMQIQNGPYSSLASRLDISSWIDFLILQEITRNVELVSPRSMYMYKNSDNVYHFGPVWDFDGGFAFDWASMTTGHEYFGSQTWLMGASNPAGHPQTAYDSIPGFFVDLFSYPEFVEAYGARWNEVHQGMLEYAFSQLDDYASHCQAAMLRNAERWPIGKDPLVEIQRMKAWLTTRAAAYAGVIEGYKASVVQER